MRLSPYLALLAFATLGCRAAPEGSGVPGEIGAADTRKEAEATPTLQHNQVAPRAGSAPDPGTGDPNTRSVGFTSEPGAVDCIDVKTEAKPNVLGGYFHLIDVKNTCQEDVECDVRTNVDSKWFNVTLRPNEMRQITSRVASQGSEFEAILRCRFP